MGPVQGRGGAGTAGRAGGRAALNPNTLNTKPYNPGWPPNSSPSPQLPAPSTDNCQKFQRKNGLRLTRKLS